MMVKVATRAVMVGQIKAKEEKEEDAVEAMAVLEPEVVMEVAETLEGELETATVAEQLVELVAAEEKRKEAPLRALVSRSDRRHVAHI